MKLSLTEQYRELVSLVEITGRDRWEGAFDLHRSSVSGLTPVASYKIYLGKVRAMHMMVGKVDGYCVLVKDPTDKGTLWSLSHPFSDKQGALNWWKANRGSRRVAKDVGTLDWLWKRNAESFGESAPKPLKLPGVGSVAQRPPTGKAAKVMRPKRAPTPPKPQAAGRKPESKTVRPRKSKVYKVTLGYGPNEDDGDLDYAQDALSGANRLSGVSIVRWSKPNVVYDEDGYYASAVYLYAEVEATGMDALKSLMQYSGKENIEVPGLDKLPKAAKAIYDKEQKRKSSF